MMRIIIRKFLEILLTIYVKKYEKLKKWDH
jgi:hypothetical protein